MTPQELQHLMDMAYRLVKAQEKQTAALERMATVAERLADGTLDLIDMKIEEYIALRKEK